MIFFMHKQSKFFNNSFTFIVKRYDDTDNVQLWHMYEAYSNGCRINV